MIVWIFIASMSILYMVAFYLSQEGLRPTLAELEAKSRQMEIEMLLTPQSRIDDTDRWIAKTDAILNPPSQTPMTPIPYLCEVCGRPTCCCRHRVLGYDLMHDLDKDVFDKDVYLRYQQLLARSIFADSNYPTRHWLS